MAVMKTPRAISTLVINKKEEADATV